MAHIEEELNLHARAVAQIRALGREKPFRLGQMVGDFEGFVWRVVGLYRATSIGWYARVVSFNGVDSEVSCAELLAIQPDRAMMKYLLTDASRKMPMQFFNDREMEQRAKRIKDRLRKTKPYDMKK